MPALPPSSEWFEAVEHESYPAPTIASVISTGAAKTG